MHIPYSISQENEWTALQLASRNGFYEIVDFLLDHGADVNQKNKVSLANILCTLMVDNGHADGSESLNSLTAISAIWELM